MKNEHEPDCSSVCGNQVSQYSSEAWSLTNIFNLSWYRNDGSFDWWVPIDHVLTVGTSVILSETITHIAGSRNRIGGYLIGDVDSHTSMQKLFTVFTSAAVLFGVKKYIINDLISQHLVPNAYKNIADQWYQTYYKDPKEEDYEVLSRVNHNIENGFIQYGNVLEGSIEAFTRLCSSAKVLFAGNGMKVPVYLVGMMSLEIFISSYIQETFTKIKETASDIRSMPYHFREDTLNEICTLKERVDELKTHEARMGWLKILMETGVSFHDIMSYKGGAKHFLPEPGSGEKDKVTVFGQSTYAATWFGGNFFRVVDLKHRLFGEVNKAICKIIEDRELLEVEQICPHEIELTGDVVHDEL
jgi:hypothetical protein